MLIDEINALDLAFVVDTTGSMSSLIHSAQQQMIGMVDELLRAAPVSLRLGVVQYRDHPPQDNTLVYRVHAFTSDLEEARATISGLFATGGGDGPEAVLDGVWAACYELAWRPHARRIAVLVGDAPPHGVGGQGDHFAQGCPCGETITSVSAAAEETRITLYAIGLRPDVESSFALLSALTGGEFFAASAHDAALTRLKAILVEEFGLLDFDRQVFAEWHANAGVSLDELALLLGTSRPAVSLAVSRLGARDLLREVSAIGSA